MRRTGTPRMSGPEIQSDGEQTSFCWPHTAARPRGMEVLFCPRCCVAYVGTLRSNSSMHHLQIEQNESLKKWSRYLMLLSLATLWQHAGSIAFIIVRLRRRFGYCSTIFRDRRVGGILLAVVLIAIGCDWFCNGTKLLHQELGGVAGQHWYCLHPVNVENRYGQQRRCGHCDGGLCVATLILPVNSSRQRNSVAVEKFASYFSFYSHGQ